jgi:hypothetical protein
MYEIGHNYGIPSPPRYIYKGEPEHRAEPQADPPSETNNSATTPSTGRYDWRPFVVTLMRALLPFPEAKQAVILALREKGAEASP